MKKEIFILIILIFIVGCSKGIPIGESATEEPIVVEEAQIQQPLEVVEEEVVEEVIEKEKIGCVVSADCESWKQCIDGVCNTVAELYETECEEKCTYNQVEIVTSDGETYTLPRGQGSYTAAGAVSWTLLGGPKYCQMEDVIVPIKIAKYNAGKIVTEEVLTLKKGETSGIIRHPTIQRISFTVTLKSLNEQCS